MKIDMDKTFFILTTHKKQEVINKLVTFGYDPIWFNPDKYFKYLIDNQDEDFNKSELKDFNKQKHLEELDYNIIAAFPKKIIRTCNPKVILNEDSPFKEYPKITETEFLEKFAMSISLTANDVRNFVWRNIPESINLSISETIEDIYNLIITNKEKFKLIIPISKYYKHIETKDKQYKHYYFRIFASKITNELKKNGFNIDLIEDNESLIISWL